MASTGSVYPFDSYKGKKGNIIVVGRIKIGRDAVLEARDFGLRRLHAAPVLNPNFGDRFQVTVAGSIGSQGGRQYNRSFAVVNGSLGSGGSLNNYVRVRGYFVRTLGSITAQTLAPQGTRGLYIGSRPGAGSMNYSFWAFGN